MLIHFPVIGRLLHFKTLKSKRKDWLGNTKDGFTGKCLFPSDNSKFKFFTSVVYVNPWLDENEARGSSTPDTVKYKFISLDKVFSK